MHDDRDRVGNPSHYPQSHTLGMNCPNSGASYGNPSPAPLGQTWTPQYPVHAQQVGQYPQHPSYGVQNMDSSVYNDAYNPAGFSSGSPAGQFGYVPNDTADGSLSYHSSPSSYYPGVSLYCAPSTGGPNPEPLSMLSASVEVDQPSPGHETLLGHCCAYQEEGKDHGSVPETELNGIDFNYFQEHLGLVMQTLISPKVVLATA
ncbi:hypothetical protein DFH06DRAFT_1293635 [Mycena polygramma]|nr:hypothetical protein DFH06DRAFT_1293635 [Mycena polygramma]